MNGSTSLLQCIYAHIPHVVIKIQLYLSIPHGFEDKKTKLTLSIKNYYLLV